jgi:hypothetical protein
MRRNGSCYCSTKGYDNTTVPVQFTRKDLSSSSLCVSLLVVARWAGSGGVSVVGVMFCGVSRRVGGNSKSRNGKLSHDVHTNRAKLFRMVFTVRYPPFGLGFYFCSC